MTTSLCGCGQTAVSPCDVASTTALERTRFFAGQILGPDDLIQDQTYFREKHRRHNRMLHGWGVVCGACVRRGQTNCEVIVEPGYILGPWGDEIVIDRDIVVDLCRQGAGEQLGCCGESLDPWCSDTRAECREGTLYLAARYAECQARPVRSSRGGCGCGCDDDGCEYSRIRDSFAIKILRDLPSSYSDPFRQPPVSVVIPCQRGSARTCPPCPAEPWVILADITVGPDCQVRAINCFAHRRNVVSFANFFFVCPPTGRGVAPPIGITRPPGLIETFARVSGGSELVDLRGAFSAEGPRATVTLRREDGTPVTFPMFFTVNAGETMADLLEREGEREFYDAITDRTLTLSDVYATAGVAPNTKLGSALDALAPLEGKTLKVALPGVPGAREELSAWLDASAMEQLDKEFGGDPARAGELAATMLAGVGPRSELGKRLRDRTVAEIAKMSRAEFFDEVVKLEKIPEKRRKDVESQAAGVWGAARRVVDVGKG
jgi:hypothetical protein